VYEYMNLLTVVTCLCLFCCRDRHGYADTCSGRHGVGLREGCPKVSLSAEGFVPFQIWCFHYWFIKIAVFWYVTLCISVDWYQRFGEKFCLSLQEEHSDIPVQSSILKVEKTGSSQTLSPAYKIGRVTSHKI
jgi:hypothetical protein